MMRLIVTCLAIALCTQGAMAQNKKAAKKMTPSPSTPAAKAASKGEKFLATGKKYLRDDNFVDAAIYLKEAGQNLGGEQKAEAHFLLATSYYKTGLKTPAAFSLMQAIKHGNPEIKRKSLDRLAVLGDALDSDAILNYTLERLPTGSLPEEAQDLVALRFGQFMLEKKNYEQAMNYFLHAKKNPRTKLKALYGIILTANYLKKFDDAEKALREFYEIVGSMPATDFNRGLGLLTLGRLNYNMKKFDEAAEWFEQIPKDHELWYQSLTEYSWSLFRAGKIKSAIGPLQTINTSFYENHYNPESLILRATIYLFLCRGDEAEKVIGIFRESFQSLGPKIEAEALVKDNNYHFLHIRDAMKAVNDIKNARIPSFKADLPLVIYRSLLLQPSIRREIQYLQTVEAEKNTIKSFAKQWRRSKAGKYAMAAYKQETKRIQNKLGELVRVNLASMLADLNEFAYQADFITLDALNVRRLIEKRNMIVTKKDVTEPEKKQREFFVQNGYRIWPFDTEYWRDEIGNFHYLGENSCAKYIK